MGYHKRIYLDNAATCLYDESVLNCANEFIKIFQESNESASSTTMILRNYLKEAREEVAGLINCDAKEVAIVESTSHALGILANSIPLKQSDNILICDLEYQASTVCWLRRQKEIGFEMRVVESKNGRVSAEDFREKIDRNTKVVLLASVQEINGFRADVKSIGEVAKEYGALFIVDGIQEVGVLQVDVKEMGADFYCAGGKKWLGNPFGAGFLYVNMETCKHIEPDYYSYFHIEVPENYDDYISYLEDPNRHPFDNYTLTQDAAKFETGGYANYLGPMGLSQSIKNIRGIGIEKIEEKVMQLAVQLVDGLHKIGIRTSSPTEQKNMSSIVTFNFGFENGVVIERQLMNYLKEKNIYVSLRCSTRTGGIRVSVNHYSSKEDISTFLNEVEQFLSKNDVLTKEVIS